MDKSQKKELKSAQSWVCWSLTSLCHSNGHIETMPAREIYPFTALTRIRSQFLRTQWSTSNHQRVDMTTPQTAQPSGLAKSAQSGNWKYQLWVAIYSPIMDVSFLNLARLCQSISCLFWDVAHVYTPIGSWDMDKNVVYTFFGTPCSVPRHIRNTLHTLILSTEVILTLTHFNPSLTRVKLVKP